MKILGIETSCDETAAAVVEDGQHLLSSEIASSMDIHALYGGVVPEIAARSHIEAIMPIIQAALTVAACNWQDIDAIAVTYGPGLGGSLLIGVLTARTLAIVHNKPLYAVDHVNAHVYANFLTDTALAGFTMRSSQPTFPILAAIVSGGHSQLVCYTDHTAYELLGQTHDDAIGEAFDKVAKILGLPYPGGPSIAKLAMSGDPTAYPLPKARVGPYDFSFSGLKTAVLRLAQAEIGESYDFPSIRLAERRSEVQKANIAASFQRVAIETVVQKLAQAYMEYSPNSVVIAGGVASSAELRRQITATLPIEVDYPDTKLCTDNAAMIATLSYFQAINKGPTADPYRLDIMPNLSM
jgi:N6-L-threonylcarbamoyladenine synthase